MAAAASDALRPSFFELFACEELSGALRPALRFALEVLSVRHPALIAVAERADEVFLAISLLLEAGSLRRDCATVAEAFYTLRRARTFDPFASPASPAAHPARRVLVGLLWAVVVPYVRRTLDDRFARRQGGAAAALLAEAQPALESPRRRRRHRRTVSFGPRTLPPLARARYALRRVAAILRALWDPAAAEHLFMQWYPSFTACTDGAQLMCRLLYLFRYSDYFSPALAVQQLVLRRATPAEYRSAHTVLDAGVPRSTAERVARALDGIVTAVKYSFFVSLVAFRFLEYYHAAEDQAPAEHAPVPPPPEPLRPAANSSVKLSERNDLCPLCSQPRVNPAALTVSGYVFCYVCILQYTVENGKCPVTLLPATSDDICRVFHEGS